MCVLGHDFLLQKCMWAIFYSQELLESPEWGLEALLTNSLSGWDKWTLHDSAECVEFQKIQIPMFFWDILILKTPILSAGSSLS